MKLLSAFVRDDSGATMVEYAFMLALILLAVLGAVSYLGGQTSALWTTNGTAMKAAGLGG